MFGIAGWQWLYIAEAVPALVLAVVVWNYLTDRPRDATWLEADERAWLVQRLEAERAQRETAHRISAWQALANPKVLALALVYFGAVAVNYGVGFFLPTIIKGFGLTTGMTTLVTAIPYAIGAAGMIWWGLRSDRKMERKGHAAIALALAAAGVAASTMFGSPVLRMAAFCVGAFGTFAVLPVFWTLPTAFLSGAAAAAGIAAINAIGNLSGFFGPFAVGYLKDATGSYSSGLLLMAACAVVAMVVVLLMGHDTALEKAPSRMPPGPMPAE